MCIINQILVTTIINLLIPFFVTLIGYIFIEFTKDKIEVTLVMPLLDRDFNLKGVMASDLGTDLNKFVVKTDQNVHMVLLANAKGLLIYHSYNVSLSLLPIYIFNTSLTGFTLDDWTSIKDTK